MHIDGSKRVYNDIGANDLHSNVTFVLRLSVSDKSAGIEINRNMRAGWREDLRMLVSISENVASAVTHSNICSHKWVIIASGWALLMSFWAAAANATALS